MTRSAANAGSETGLRPTPCLARQLDTAAARKKWFTTQAHVREARPPLSEAPIGNAHSRSPDFAHRTFRRKKSGTRMIRSAEH